MSGRCVQSACALRSGAPLAEATSGRVFAGQRVDTGLAAPDLTLPSHSRNFLFARGAPDRPGRASGRKYGPRETQPETIGREAEGYGWVGRSG